MATTSFEHTVRGLEQKCAQAEKKCSSLSKEVKELQQTRSQPVHHKSTQTVAAVLPSSTPTSPRAVEVESKGVCVLCVAVSMCVCVWHVFVSFYVLSQTTKICVFM